MTPTATATLTLPAPGTAAPGAGARPAVALSVLDLGARAPGTPAEQAVQDIVHSARTADEHGYARMWVAEHHSSAKTAGSAPAVLIAHIAAHTRRIRVGSGGVMLPNHPPYTVAEQFATLQALNPGRIDLGVGRSPGRSDAKGRLIVQALRRSPTAIAEFPALLDELLGFLHHRGPGRHRFHALPLTPRPATAPEVYVLGGGGGSARIAAERGLPFAYGHHLGRSKCRPEAAAHYRAAFRPGPGGARPHLIVSVNVVCAPDDAQAEELAVTTAVQRVLHPDEPPPVGALTPVRKEYLARRGLDELQVVYGGPATVAARLGRIAADVRADEVMVTPYEISGVARCRTLRLVASALGGVGGRGRDAPAAGSAAVGGAAVGSASVVVGSGSAGSVAEPVAAGSGSAGSVTEPVAAGRAAVGRVSGRTASGAAPATAPGAAAVQGAGRTATAHRPAETAPAGHALGPTAPDPRTPDVATDASCTTSRTAPGPATVSAPGPAPAPGPATVPVPGSEPEPAAAHPAPCDRRAGG